ncbi:MAG: hypothetical protein M0003_02575 [Acidithiobacillus sp.]|nr:hypothetical protein [Acidithiobacillus sp.]
MIANAAQYLVFRRGIVYEGGRDQLWALYPMPLISPATCERIEERNLVFREDSFDPLTRIRRGRFYQRHGGRGAMRWQALFVSNGLYGQLLGVPYCGEFDEEDSCKLVRIPDEKTIRTAVVQIGTESATTAWRVVDIEQNLFGQQVVTLRAKSLFGVLPELSGELLDKQNSSLKQDKITQIGLSLDRLVDTHHRLQPVPTVDVARETARVILAAWIGSEADSKDLKDVIDLIPEKMGVLRNTAYIVNRLHPRAKTAEQEAQARKGSSLREPTEDDAQTSVHLIGMMLREIGWATA